MAEHIKVGLLGFGTVGSHFYKMTQERPDITAAYVLSRRPRPELDCTVTSSIDEILSDESVDIVVEVIGGLSPALEYITASMRAGKNVVTANKQVVSAHFAELISLAKECGVSLRCTAAAGGGIPWLSSLSRVSRMDRLLSVSGILNGTTNFILSEMAENSTDYAVTLKKAQELGYAEADPSSDVNGTDTLRKLVISANIAFGVLLDEKNIPCAGISSVTAEDIRLAREDGLTLKLFAHAQQGHDGISAFVCPTLFPSSAIEAHTCGANNIISLNAEKIGRQSFYGAGAGGFPTASNVLADCLSIPYGGGSFYRDDFVPSSVNCGQEEYEWLFRHSGVYSWLKCSVSKAFDLYAAYQKDDPSAFMARIAKE